MYACPMLNKSGETALHIAAKNSTVCLKLLIDFGCSNNPKDVSTMCNAL